MFSLRIVYSLLFSLLTIIIITTPVSATTDIQQLIDNIEEGATLYLQPGTYEGNFSINKAMTIVGEDGVILKPKVQDEPIITIIGAKDVSVKGLQLETKGTGLEIKDSEHILLSDVIMMNVDSGIKIYRSKNVDIQQISVTGNDQHYSKKGNGIAAFNSSNLIVKNNRFNKVQDGIYIENVKGTSVENNKVENSRYGTHFMYSEDVQALHNEYIKNETGLMIMMTKNVMLSQNEVSYQDGFNGTGITLYEVENIDIQEHIISGNRVAISIQKTTGVHIANNILQMNQTAIESIKSDNTNLVVKNYFVGNLVNVRSDMDGIFLKENYYDDYAGIDIDHDGIGEESYVALQSFGQWMVRKPVYQYYVEAPSVVLLNEIDKQTNRGAKQLLVDETPTTIFNVNKKIHFEIHSLQLIIGLFLVIGCVVIWRRSVLS